VPLLPSTNSSIVTKVVEWRACHLLNWIDGIEWNYCIERRETSACFVTASYGNERNKCPGGGFRHQLDITAKRWLAILKVYNLPNVTRFYLRSVSRIRQAKAKKPLGSPCPTAKS
jgi:hypothetical protein